MAGFGAIRLNWIEAAFCPRLAPHPFSGLGGRVAVLSIGTSAPKFTQKSKLA